VSRRARIRLGAGAAAAALAATVLSVTAPAGASTNAATRAAIPARAVIPARAGSPAAASAYGAWARLTLRAMPAGRISFRRDSHHQLMVRAALFGLTPGSSHAVDLWVPGR
jgi:hypothetical protein